MSPAGKRKIIDFDGDPTRLLQDCYAQGEAHQRPRWRQAQRDWLAYNAYMDMRQRDPNMPNVSLPKIYSIVETKNPKVVMALFGRHPLFPLYARERALRPVTDVFAEALDYYSTLGGLYELGSLLAKLATLYGTGYIEAIPYYDRVIKSKLMPSNVGGYQKVQEENYRLRFLFNVFAVWEVLHDPIATHLNGPGGCRWVIKPHLTSKRAIKRLYGEGAYPDFDIEKLDATNKSGYGYQGTHFGLQMLQAYGLPIPADDDDVGVILRYESEDRYIDSWMGELVLRDGDNPFSKENQGHGGINLAKLINTQTPHTQQQWYGIGEAKPAEVLTAILNDSVNMTLSVGAMLSQPLVFYRGEAIERDDILFSPGHRIAIKSLSSNRDRPIRDDYEVWGGQPLPPQHYELPNLVERFIDLGSGEFGPGRGEGMRSGSNTASEAIIATEKGSERQEGQLMLDESGFKTTFCRQLLGHMGQFAQFNDLAEVVGEQRALLAYVSNPSELPGGYHIEYSGSARVRRREIQRQQLIEAGPIIQGSIAARPGGLERKLLDLTEFNQDEQDDILLTPEELDMAIKQNMMIEQQQAEREYQQQRQLGFDKQEAKPGPAGGGNAFTRRAKEAANA